MLVIPAIDILHGNCVRLYQGRQDQETIYSRDPVRMAEQWESKGAPMLHIADLDGAFAGKPRNLKLIAQIRQSIRIPIEVGGGYRDLASIESALSIGIEKVILGTAAIHNPELVIAAVNEWGPAVAVSIDVADERVTVSGWKEVSSLRFEDVTARMRDFGVSEMLFTDTRKDGTMSGPNLPLIRRFLAAAEVPVIVSGGISSLEDIQDLKQLEGEGLSGVVLGKALYDHKILLEDALRVTRA